MCERVFDCYDMQQTRFRGIAQTSVRVCRKRHRGACSNGACGPPVPPLCPPASAARNCNEFSLARCIGFRHAACNELRLHLGSLACHFILCPSQKKSMICYVLVACIPPVHYYFYQHFNSTFRAQRLCGTWGTPAAPPRTPGGTRGHTAEKPPRQGSAGPGKSCTRRPPPIKVRAGARRRPRPLGSAAARALDRPACAPRTSCRSICGAVYVGCAVEPLRRRAGGAEHVGPGFGVVAHLADRVSVRKSAGI
jgi:hypothetical protein